MSVDLYDYSSSIEKELDRLIAAATRARRRMLDPKPLPEPKIARDMAERVEKLIGPPGVGDRIRELSKTLPDRELLAFKIAEEIIYEASSQNVPAERTAKQALKTALAILTEGVTAAPLQGIVDVRIKLNADRSRYMAVYFAGPIRSAGGTEQGLTIVLADYIRQLLGLDAYKPTKEEIKRIIEEIRLYERRVARFQYHISDEFIEAAIENLPIEITGTGTDPFEVSSFRDLPRIETNQVRGGALLVINDGLLGRARKIWAIVEKLKIDGWRWLKSSYEIKEGLKEAKIEETIIGRPIFSTTQVGGFRLRYGRSRNTGLAAVGLHPATMIILDDFLAIGTQLRLDRPGKAGIVMPVDSIEPPVVKLKSGSVIRVSTIELASKIRGEVDKILFLGDILISVGDYLENNKPLDPSPFTEEWWAQESLLIIEKNYGSVAKAAQIAGIPTSNLDRWLNKPLQEQPSCEEATLLAQALGIPLHPRYTFFWNAISLDELLQLRELASRAKVMTKKGVATQMAIAFEAKSILEKLVIPHQTLNNSLILTNETFPALRACLGLNRDIKAKRFKGKSTLEAVRELSEIDVRDVVVSFIEARMGRPEKAKRREMKPPTHLLFPTGLAGGPTRNLIEAVKEEIIEVELVKRKCKACDIITIFPTCPHCGSETMIEAFCSLCKVRVEGRTCPRCKGLTRSFGSISINLRSLVNDACLRLKCSPPSLLKGVKGLVSWLKTPELIEKGILRAKYNLTVFKDGTIRFDCTNAPLTHFKPSEVRTSVEKLKRLGYITDSKGNPLTNPDQLCELKPQDLVIPKEAATYLLRIAKFVDELLEKVHGLPPYYKAEREEDLVGHLVIGLSPHTSVGVVGRIVGFTEANVCYAHPYWHAAKRRDCDGDEDAIMLALDVLINFSEDYLPSHIGGIMDAPLLITPIVNPMEIDEEAHNVDVCKQYPLILYQESTLEGYKSFPINVVDFVFQRLGSVNQYSLNAFTHPTSNIEAGNLESAYKKLGKMTDKLTAQILLSEKISVVDAGEVIKTILSTHLIPDMVGNLRSFLTQKFRCKRCNRKLRRIPLTARCPCGGELTLTVHKGNVDKYLKMAEELTKEFHVKGYYCERVLLTKREIEETFLEEEQKLLMDFI